MRVHAIAALALAGAGAAAGVRAGSAELDDAELAFHRHCAACHSLEKGEHKVGPSLHGIYGRKAAASQGFPYSDALRRLDLVWSDSNLDAYLLNAQALAPGSNMRVRLPEEGARKAIVMLLRSQAPAAP